MTNQGCRSALARPAHLLLRGRGRAPRFRWPGGAGRKQAGGRSCFLSLKLKGILSAFPQLDSERVWPTGSHAAADGWLPGRPLQGVTSCEGRPCWLLLLFFSVPGGRLISRNTEPLEAHKAEPGRSGIVSLLPPRSRVCFPTVLFPSGKRWLASPVGYSCAPSPGFPPIVPAAFYRGDLGQVLCPSRVLCWFPPLECPPTGSPGSESERAGPSHHFSGCDPS